MKAVVLESYGDPEVLKVDDIPEPTPGPGRGHRRGRRVRARTGPTCCSGAAAIPGRSSSTADRTFDIPGMELSGTDRRARRPGHRVRDRRRGDGDRERGRLRGAVRGARAPAAVGPVHRARHATRPRSPRCSSPRGTRSSCRAGSPQVASPSCTPARPASAPRRSRSSRRSGRRSWSRRRRERSRRAERSGPIMSSTTRARTSSPRPSSSPADAGSTSSST